MAKTRCQTFFARQSGISGTNFLFWMGVIMIPLGLVGFVTGSTTLGLQAGLGVLLLISSNWLKSNPIVRLHNDHLEMKAAIAAPKHLILFAEISDLVVESSKKVFVVTKVGKRVRLPMVALEEQDGAALLEALRARLAVQTLG